MNLPVRYVYHAHEFYLSSIHKEKNNMVSRTGTTIGFNPRSGEAEEKANNLYLDFVGPTAFRDIHERKIWRCAIYQIHKTKRLTIQTY